VLGIDNTSHKGFMTKQGIKNKNWKRRFMILKGNTLSYFATQNASYPKGKVTIESSSQILFADENKIGKKNCFAIKTSHRIYFMFCDKIEETVDWVYALRAAVHYSNMKDLMNTESQLRIPDIDIMEKQGILQKQGGVFATIKQRYFRLRDFHLYYYHNSEEDIHKPINIIPLKDAEVTRVKRTDSAKYAFRIQTQTRQYFLFAETEKEQKAWVEALEYAATIQSESKQIQAKSIQIHQIVLEKSAMYAKKIISPHSPYMFHDVNHFHRSIPLTKDIIDQLSVS
jgi:hypothetical protein